jgi:hypothetical protein
MDFDLRLFVDEEGVHLKAASQFAPPIIGVIRQKVFRTLEENGVPNEIVHIDPEVTSELPSDFVSTFGAEQGSVCKGKRRRFTFRFTKYVGEWFLDEEGRRCGTLKIV